MHSIYPLSLLLALTLLAPSVLKAQNNQVITGPASTTPGTLNTIIRLNYGVNVSQENVLTGTENTLIGNGAGAAYRGMTNRNTIIGSRAGAFTFRSQLATTQDNTLLGVAAGQSLVGSYNTFTGSGAGAMEPPGQGAPINSGAYNTFTGYQAGYANQGGSYNTYLGSSAGYSTTNGASNVAIGIRAFSQNQVGNNNVALGDSAGFNNTVSGNVFLGSKAGFTNTTGTNNTFLGFQTGYKTTTGIANVFIGYQAGYSNQTGTGNMFLGQLAGYNSVGSYNLFMGNSSGQNTTTGSGNTAIGDGSGLNNSSGQRNTYIGQYAGLNQQTGTDNVFIGYAAHAGTNNPTNVTNSAAIGANAVVNQSNSIVLGSGANVGIGNSAPSATLHITAGQDNSSGLRLEKLTSNSPATGNQTKFLTVDGSGNVILGASGNGGRIIADEAMWQRTNGGLLQSVQNNGVVIGQGVSATPAGYKLFVEQGILTERVKVAVKSTSDWSDYVFAPGYQLAPLSQVEAHIQRTGHLPGVPSAQQMVEQGNDLHKTDAKLLEKIEELTLYSIQLEKADRAKEREVEQLKTEVNELKQLVKQLLNKK